jgi:hypothetical protein
MDVAEKRLVCGCTACSWPLCLSESEVRAATSDVDAQWAESEALYDGAGGGA